MGGEKKIDGKVDIAVFVSGGGTNLQALIDFERSRADCPYRVVLVVSSSKNARAVERAMAARVPVEVASPVSVMGAERAKIASRDEKREAVSDAAAAMCVSRGVQAIVLAGYLTVLRGRILRDYSGRIVNLHPALLPKFGGVGMWGRAVHEAVIVAGEKETGCTVHLVDAGCDTGEILVQKKIPVFSDDTPETLAARLAPLEHEAIVEGVRALAEKLREDPPA